MSTDDDVLALSVPVGVAALYLVATSDPPADARAAVEKAVADLDDPVARPAQLMLEHEWLTVDVTTTAEHPVPLRALELFAATPAQLERLAAATHLLRVRAIGKAWWEPYHEWAARAIAASLADERGVDLIDTSTPRVLSATQARHSLPDRTGEVALNRWVTVVRTHREDSDWLTTLGLRRYGLPELQSVDVPAVLVRSWTEVLLGAAARVVDEWQATLTAEDRPSFVEIPAEFLVREADVARAHAAPARGDGATRIRLRHDPSADLEQATLLRVGAPAGFTSASAAFYATATAELFGPATPEVHRRERDAAMDAAIATARSGLDAARGRWQRREFDAGTELIVKHGLARADGGNEYVWASVTDWSDPDRPQGASLNDAESDPSVRVGAPAHVDAESIVDWAVLHDGAIIEGGWTDQLFEP